MNPQIHASELGTSPLFSSVPFDSIQIYLEECQTHELVAGTTLLQPDEPNTSVFVVIKGALDVALRSAREGALVTLGQGATVGEMSIVEGKEPSAFVTAAQDTTVLEIPQKTLWAMLNVSHAVARNLLAIISKRLRADNKIIRDSAVILRQFQHRSMTDALTSLYNRRWMDEMFGREIKRCQAEGFPVCLIMLDVDNFKTFNNQHGHLTGDNALCAVSDNLQSYFRPTDLVARFGGDEFGVLLPHTELHSARVIAERVRRGVEENTKSQRAQHPVTISLGIAELREKEDYGMLLNRADAALYRAKLAGRNTVSD